MKLIYIWIEKYKNVHDLDIVLDKRYEIIHKWQDDELLLTIRKVKNAANNIWGDNYNISALVGKNGAGKSAVLEAVNSVQHQIYSKENPYCGRCFLLFENQQEDGCKEKFFCITALDKNFKIKITDCDSSDYNEYAPIHSLNSQVALYSYDNNRSMYKNIPTGMFETLFNFDNIKYVFTKYKNDSPFFFINKHLKFEKYNYNLPYGDFIKAVGNFFGSEAEGHRRDAKTPRYHFIKQISHMLTDYNKRKINILSSDAVLVLFDFIWWITEQYPEIYDDIDFGKNPVGEINREQVNKIITGLMQKNERLKSYPLSSVERIYDELKKGKNAFESEKLELSAEDNFKNYFASVQMNSLVKLDYFAILPIFKNEIQYSRLSNGERQIINVMSWIYRFGENNNLLLIDEGETFMHPEWQRRYIFYLTKVLNKIYRKHHKYINVIVATHSPMILSDFLNDNVFFLEMGKRRDDVNLKCFGANIYDLYNDGFFVEASVGEFARKKIISIDERIKSGEVEKNDYALIEQIGEPMLRQALKNKLSSRRDLSIIKDYLEKCLADEDPDAKNLLSVLSEQIRERGHETD